MSAIKNLSKAITFETISKSTYSHNKWNYYQEFIVFLKETYPRCYEKMTFTRINEYSLVYHWKGKNADKKPILLMAHYDVVPIEIGTEKDWTHPPFSGHMDGEYIWGRGTLDMKSQLICILEAAEALLADEFTPEQDIYFAFGHDEEVGGPNGAAKVAEYFIENKLDFEFAIDEGGCILTDAVNMVNKPIALVGLSEKGYLNIKLSAKGTGGHASMPPKKTSLNIIADIISNIEKNPMKMKIAVPIKRMMKILAPHTTGINKIVLGNLNIFGGFFKRIFGKSSMGNALLRSTFAATMSSGSMAPNVLPQKSEVIFNVRIAPWNTGEEVINHFKEVNKGIDFDIEVMRLDKPSQISSPDSRGFELISECIGNLYDDVIVSPYIMVAGTDCPKYEDICEDMYRFTAYIATKAEIDCIHSTNEKISYESVDRVVGFFKLLMQKL